MKEANGIARKPVPATMSASPGTPAAVCATAFGYPRDFLSNRYVYAVVSPRARGLSLGVNLNPDGRCNFNCVYCEVDRRQPAREQVVEVERLTSELRQTLALVHADRLRERPRYRTLPAELLQLRHVALSGDGEPTLAPNFAQVLRAVLHVRALGEFPFFKVVLITNATGLDLPEVQAALEHFTGKDEVWAKLDGGTQEYLNKVNGAEVPLAKIMANLKTLGCRRPLVIQSLFPALDEHEPPLDEIAQYAQRLSELQQAGTQISLVQIYSATRPVHNPSCGHLPLKSLSGIAQLVRRATGLRVEVY